MKNASPRKLAIYSSMLIIGVIIPVFIIAEFFLYQHIHWYVLAIVAIAVLLVSFFIFQVVLEKFIYGKIRLIYKTIHQLKAPKNSINRTIDYNSDLISNVNQQVLNWAEDKKLEIDHLKKLEAYRREFLGNVSHELKTPIFNIQGYVLTLLDGGLEDNNINREYLIRTEKSVERMISIIEDLESISRLESGELVIELSRFDIVALTKEIIEFLEIKANKKNIKLRINKNHEMPIFVYADKNGIRQVITNLIDNSIKYSDENGRTKISFFDMDENILVEITDRGIGIAQENIPRVFERFFRTDKSRSREQGGSGLGLSIVKHIIEAHNQTINVRSTIGVGSTFGFTLKKSK